jgi:hypothetical protein
MGKSELVMFKLSPGGIGTGRVEQLSSFAIRYSEILSVSFIDFYRDLVAQRLYSGRRMPERVKLVSRVVVDGITKTAVDWVAALAQLSSAKDLSTCTLLPFAGTLGARNLVSPIRRWCPVCLREMAHTGSSVIYEPLVWRLPAITACSSHKHVLVDICPVCRKGGQLPFVANARVGCCRHCGAWMAASNDSGQQNVADEFELFAAEQAEQLLALPAKLDSGAHILPGTAAVRALRDVFFEGNGAQMGRALGELAGQVNGYAAGEFPAPLAFYLRAAYVTGASMNEIFVSNDFHTHKHARTSCSFSLRRAQSGRAVEQAALERALRDALNGDGRKSVRAVAIDLCLEPVTAWRRSPRLCSEVSRNHARYVAKSAANRRAEFQSNVAEVLLTFRKQGVKPTTKQIKDALKDSACFLNDWKREVIGNELARLGF